LIWRTSTRSYLACLFCARAPLVQSFCLFVLHFAFGVGAFNTTTYCSVSRMSWTCAYLGSVWGKHTRRLHGCIWGFCARWGCMSDFFLWDNCALIQSAPEDSESRMRVSPMSRLVWENVLLILGAVLPFVFVDHKFNVCWSFKGQDLMGVGALWHDISQSPFYTVAIVPQSNQQPLHQHLFILVSVFCWSHPNRATGTFIVH
jgi:hypothetical protein